eukprot:CAMPEP_0181225438 /NCGR_PEP_ID=MMETSP1096-20121128/31692_1 /TAXON_ID=156174 ORGANISM="Chrysochromulina ericina, Strain CCMP281" /NCGR_SAMPLE_ID=MMETSP1096 /ASSEMBLY_ACC=CAM_ASM_000453 /LENGTH=94 /DNA_ID=CAMNT_0023318651 /DNA_START=931 /DNA_END=1215 /DNA_ORIENTATION=+
MARGGGRLLCDEWRHLDACNLHIRYIELLLHDLFQDADGECLRLKVSQILVVLLLQLRLCALGPCANRLGIKAGERARRIGMVQHWPVVIPARD